MCTQEHGGLAGPWFLLQTVAILFVTCLTSMVRWISQFKSVLHPNRGQIPDWQLSAGSAAMRDVDEWSLVESL